MDDPPGEKPRDPDWRPIDPHRDVFEPPGVPLADWPDDLTVLSWWHNRDAWFRRQR